MMAVTHGVFTVFLIVVFGVVSKSIIGYLLLGSVLPDIDHPQSAIGRIFFFISYPLNRRIGHRTVTHSILLWSVLGFIGYLYFKPLFWITLGACSHLFLDCWTSSGVSLFRPITEKIFVMADKKHRLKVGSKQELIVMGIFILLIYGGLKINEIGGMRGIIRNVIADYNTVVKEYEKQGLKVCYIEGDLRYSSGIIEKGSWLIVGKNRGTESIAIYDEKRKNIVKIPEEGEFLKSYLKKSDEKWNMIKLEKAMVIKEGEVYYKVTQNWHRAKIGDVAAGDIIYRGKVAFGEYE